MDKRIQNMKNFLYLAIIASIFSGCVQNTTQTPKTKQTVIYPDCIPTASGDSECEEKAKLQYQSR